MGGFKHGKTKLPSGKEVTQHNGDKGFVVRGRLTLKCHEGWKQYLPWKYVEFENGLQLGKRGFDIFPAKMDVSKHHVTVACLNNYYFIRDQASKHGTYIRIGLSAKNKRVELHKGSTFAVGRVHFKVSELQGSAADNLEKMKEMEEEAREKAEAKEKAEAAGKATGEKEPELESDEEFADDTDDEDDKKSSKGSSKKGKFDGPPVMFLSTIDKKLKIKGRVRETSTIGSDKEKNKISIEEAVAKAKNVDKVHTRICLEDGHFYLEDAGSSFGTWAGLPKKKFFEIHVFDHIMLGGARCTIGMNVVPFQFIQGIIDKLLGTMNAQDYPMKILGSSSSYEERLQAAHAAGK